MAGDSGAFVVRNTFIEVADDEDFGAEPVVRRWNSAPPSLGAEKKVENDLDVFDGPRLASSSAVYPRLASSSVAYDSPQQKCKRPAWEPPSAREAEEWLGTPASGLAREEGPEADGDEVAPEEGLEGRDIATMTTVILRNVPHSYTRDDLLDLLDSQGFYARYDFLYLPVKFGSSSAFGYAFINLVEHEDARRFQAHFQNFTNWNVPCNNSASVSWSKAHQGLTEHIERYRNSPMMHPTMPDDCKPIIMKNGQRVEFPPPTKKASPTRRTAARQNRKNKDTAGSRGAPGSVSSLASDLRSEVSCSSDHWKAGSTVSSTSTPAGSTIAPLAEPMSSPLFQGLTWLGGGEERGEAERSEVGLYQLTTQMICGSDTSSEQSMRSSARSQMTSISQVPSTCSSKGRRGYGATTLLAAGLEAVPDTVEQLSQGPRDDGKRRQKDRKWWNPFSSNNGTAAAVPAAQYDSPSRRPPRQEPSHKLAAAPQPFLPGSIVELVGGAGPPGQQGRIMVVDHARESYKVQLGDGNIRMVKARQVRFVR